MIVPLDSGSPAVAASAWIAPGATLAGDVRVGENASVWYGAVLRADGDSITIAAGANVQDNVIMHADPGTPVTIGTATSVGHGAIVHSATVEHDTVIGMGAIVQSRAVIGHHSLIGAGALITEGKVIPPYSVVVGVPGKIIRTANETDLAYIADDAAVYLTLAARHRQALEA